MGLEFGPWICNPYEYIHSTSQGPILRAHGSDLRSEVPKP